MWRGMLLASGLIAVFGLAQVEPASADAPPPDLALPSGIDVQTRGPVHEAFAQPTDLQLQPGPIVAQQPPAPIPEQIPDQRPEGDNVEWIPGYWAWDAERSEYRWISGTLRNAPPGRRYVPGYWVEADGGWRWVAGFWAAAEQEEVPYVPEPPAPRDVGPTVPAPGADYFFVPGYWTYRVSNWVWRPGFWNLCRPGRIWIAAHFVWTPAGYCFVDGYWDYPLEDRGLLFAPVTFAEPYWLRPGWFYRPAYVLRPPLL